MKRTEFQQTLRQLRRQHGLKQDELSRKLKVHVTTLKNWESGNSVPDAENICAIADFFHVSTDYLLGRDHGDMISVANLSPRDKKFCSTSCRFL